MSGGQLSSNSGSQLLIDTVAPLAAIGSVRFSRYLNGLKSV